MIRSAANTWTTDAIPHWRSCRVALDRVPLWCVFYMDRYLPHDATQASYLDLSSLLLHFHRRHARAALIRTVQMIDWLFFTPIRDGMANRMKELLEAGKPAIGSQLRFGNPAIAELFGLAGFDWLLIDSEHAPQTPNGVQAQLQAIGNTPATPIMRLPAVNVEQIRLYLDMGAMGLAAAFVNTAEEAELGAQSCRYPPRGTRGWGPHRATRYGLMDNDTYEREVADHVMFIPIIETAQAIENIDAIMAVDGVDTVLVGPADLSISLGAPFDFACQDYRNAQRKVVDACRAVGKPAGTAMLGSPFDAKALQSHLDLGFTVIMVGGDVWYLTASCGIVNDIRKQVGC